MSAILLGRLNRLCYVDKTFQDDKHQLAEATRLRVPNRNLTKRGGTLDGDIREIFLLRPVHSRLLVSITTITRHVQTTLLS